MTTQASTAQPLQRDAVGVAFVLLSGLGVVFLPTTAKFAYLDGSNVITVAFARGAIAVVLLMLVALAMRQSLRMPRALLRPSLIGEIAEPRSNAGWFALAGNGIAYCVAWVAFFAGARILGATRASVLSLVEPPAAALGAWLLFGETYSPLQWCGFCIVLAAIFMFEKLSNSSA